MDKKLLDKLGKLLALSSSPNINEANLAMEMAERLMVENNVTIGDINSQNLVNELGEIGKTEVKYKTHRPPVYEIQLRDVIAKHFGCQGFTSSKYADKLYKGRPYKVYAHSFVGHEGNRRTCEIMFGWLLGIILKEARRRYKSFQEVSSFAYAAGVELQKKYEERKAEEVKPEAVTSRELMIVDDVQNWVDQNMNLKDKSLKVWSDGASEVAGKEFGKTLSLNRQFGLKQICA